MCSMMEEGFAVSGMWVGKPVGSYVTALAEGSSTLAFDQP